MVEELVKSSADMQERVRLGQVRSEQYFVSTSGEVEILQTVWVLENVLHLSSSAIGLKVEIRQEQKDV